MSALPKTSCSDSNKNININSSSSSNKNNNSGNMATITPCFPSALYHQVATLHSQENVIVSPLLLEAMLALLFLGSDGATAEELNARLQLKRFGNNSKMAHYYADVLDTFSNGSTAETKIYTLQHFLLADGVTVSDEFKRIALRYFHTTTENTVVANAMTLQQQLNRSLEQTPPFDKQPGGINASLSAASLSAESHAVLLSAASFQSKWFLPFSAYRSGMYDFYTALDESAPSPPQPVPMMFDDDMFVKFGEFRELDARAIELPYEHEEELAMLLVLPNQRDGLPELEQRLRTMDLYDLAERMQIESVQVLLPKFHVGFQTSLKEILKQIGISTIFNKTANFNNLLKDKDKNHQLELPISDIFHVVYLEVNESGSETPAKVTPNKPIVISNSIDTRKKFFRADHPFYFAIRSRDVILFAGHVTKF